jgi:hypothetical protein
MINMINMIQTRMRLIDNTAIGSLQSQPATIIFDTHTPIAHWKPRSQFKYRSVIATSRCVQSYATSRR